ncbi:MAG: Flp pilus assembly protein CpaB [Proteobacteria bacterium]|nr:Flp pilus assembly protein CpaB [Pseudomonadota bacterium]MCP4917515.1 Flp pilus assembly protein CpaB [Pseudomonadota bacterium]
MKNPKAFLAALVTALLMTLVQCRYVAQREQEVLFKSEPLPTLVATQDIPANFKLDETMVEVREVPRNWRQPKALTEVEDILGQITSNPILEGEQVLATKLVKPDEAGLAFYVPKKMRAVAIAVDEFNAVGGHIKPGNYVDVVGTFDFGQSDKSDVRTVTLFQNVWVLSVGDDIGQPQAVLVNDGDEEVYQPTGLSVGRTVTLAVYPDEAQKLVMAQELGDLSLTLRSLWETERSTELEHATIHNTLGIPQAVRHRQRARWEVIRSGGF